MSRIDEFYFEANTPEYVFWSWPQTWPNTSCGFGGISGRAMTTRQTYLFHFLSSDTYDVYHNGRYAYSLRDIEKSVIETCIKIGYCPGRKAAPGIFQKHFFLNENN